MEFDATTLPGLDLPEFPPGLVWLVGAGPGAPGLLAHHPLPQWDTDIPRQPPPG